MTELSPRDDLNRSLRLMLDRSLVEVLAGLTILLLWVAVVGFALLVTYGAQDPTVHHVSKALLIVGGLFGTGTGLSALILFFSERNEKRKNRSHGRNW